MRSTVYAHHGGHNIGYAIKSLHSPSIMPNGRPINIDAPLAGILRRW
jgi:hypothetical protein